MAEIYGYLAATCVMTASTFDRLFVVRLASLLSNIFFVAYALSENLMPVLALHATLLPLNGIKVLAFFKAGVPVGDGRAPEPARHKALQLRMRESVRRSETFARPRDVKSTERADYRAPI